MIQIQVVDELKRALVVLAMPHGSIVCTVRIDRERCEEGQVCHRGEVCYYLVASDGGCYCVLVLL